MSPSMPLTFASSFTSPDSPARSSCAANTNRSAVKSPQGLLYSFHFEVLHLLHGERTTIFVPGVMSFSNKLSPVMISDK